MRERAAASRSENSRRRPLLGRFWLSGIW